MLPVFVYGTLRPGSWNHDRCLAPWLARPCRPAQLAGHSLHHHRGLPYLVAEGRADRMVTGHLGDLDPTRYGAALDALDALEDVGERHYDRVEVTVGGGERAWAWIAGPAVAAQLSDRTLVASGDFLRLAG